MMGPEKVELPPGLTEEQWVSERDSWQNPRLRHLLGCVQSLDEVMESNYAILHCSPTRLVEIWERLHKAAATIRLKLEPLLQERSQIAAIEGVRFETAAGLKKLERSVLPELDRFPKLVPETQYESLRRFLCGALGRVHAFLLDALGHFLAADPRSEHDADYFMAKRFVRDVDEAEWLETSVGKLEQYLRQLNRARLRSFVDISDQVKTSGRVPDGERWEEIGGFLDELVSGLSADLRQVVGLRGIRVDELELLEQYASEVPALCGVLEELHQAALAATGRLEDNQVDETETSAREAGLEVVHSVFSGRMVRVMTDLDGHLRDLLAFITLWHRGIRRRRALMFGKPLR